MNAFRMLPVILIICCLATSCNYVDEQLEDRESSIERRAVIKAYSSAIERVKPLEQVWVSSVQKTNSLRDVTAIHSSIRSNVVPALREYITSLKQVPVVGSELRHIHSELLGSLSRLLDHYLDFVAGVSRENYDTKRKLLQVAFGKTLAGQRSYRERLDAYYRSNGIELLSVPTERAP